MTRAEAQVAFSTVRVVALAETLGLIPRSPEAGIDVDELFDTLDAFAKVGIGRRSSALCRRVEPAELAQVLRGVLAAAEESPLPDYEWAPLTSCSETRLSQGLSGYRSRRGTATEAVIDQPPMKLLDGFTRLS